MNKCLCITLALGLALAAVAVAGADTESVQLPSNLEEIAGMDTRDIPLYSGFCIRSREAVRNLLEGANSPRASFAFNLLIEFSKNFVDVAVVNRNNELMSNIRSGRSALDVMQDNWVERMQGSLRRQVFDEHVEEEVGHLCANSAPLLEDLDQELQTLNDKIETEMERNEMRPRILYNTKTLPCETMSRLVEFTQACDWRMGF